MKTSDIAINDKQQDEIELKYVIPSIDVVVKYIKFEGFVFDQMSRWYTVFLLELES